MKKLKKTILLILAAILFTLAAPAETVRSPFAVTAQAAVGSSVRISTKKKTLFVGKSFTLKIRGTGKKVRWTSSDKSVASVSSKGKVTAKKPGTAVITGKVGGKKYTCRVTVKKAPAKTTYILNTNTKVFHYSWCSSCDRMAPKNRLEYTGTREEVIVMDYRPCKRCNP